jgi:hypothetical protein
MFGPVWWHRHGSKLRVSLLNTSEKILVLKSVAASLDIRLTAEAGFWCVTWYIKNSQTESVRGNMIFNTDFLEAAFGLRKLLDPSPVWMEKYNADVGRQGRFIRKCYFLNIPGPGTGHDCDPNISIEVTEEIRNAVKLLIGK